MANSDRKRMLELGKWLEKCLNPYIKLIEINNIFEEGVTILKVKCRDFIPETLFENIDTNSDEDEFNRFGIFGVLSGMTEEERQPIVKLQNEIRLLRIQDRPQTNNDSMKASNFLERLNELNQIPNLSFSEEINFIDFLFLNELLLRYLLEIKLSWRKVFYTLSNKKNDALGYIISINLQSYSSIVEIIDGENGEYKLQKKFHAAFEDTIPRYMALFSHIFFNFLILGGQKHIVFCKRCGRFSVGKRLKPDGNPEKQFCTDICRTANGRF